ncbi:MAG: hypothetical protein ACXAC2_12825, partial [Candidatus Kariarchaeaceae archaeon]
HLKSVVVEYSTDGGTTFLNTALSRDSNTENGWKGIVAKFDAGTSIVVRIVATDDAGNSRTSEEFTFSVEKKSGGDDSPLSTAFMILALITAPILLRKFRKNN